MKDIKKTIISEVIREACDADNRNVELAEKLTVQRANEVYQKYEGA